MSAIFVLLQLAGNVALLLWGIHMVQSGVMRAFGTTLRSALSTGLDSRWRAFLAGFGITAVMQSSTATALMAASFMAGGLISFVPAMAAVLGANVGSTVIVQLLSFNVTAVAPLLVLAGVVAFRRGQKTRVRDLGRVAIGLGLVLLALRGVIVTIEPIEHAEAVRQLLALLASDPVMNVVIGALLTWASFSSVATVLLVMALGAAHVIAPPAMLSLVLGANLGIVIPQYLGTGRNPVAQRLALGNLIVRATGCLAVVPFLGPIQAVLSTVEADPARQAANFHAVFNVLLAAAFMGLLGPLSKLCECLLPAQTRTADRGTPRYLAHPDLSVPGIGIVNAQREVLRIVDLVKDMVQAFGEALDSDDRKKLIQVAALDDSIDQLHGAVKAHLIAITRADALDEADLRRCTEILNFAINLEHVGDILDMSLRELATRKIKNRLRFAPEGSAQIGEMQDRLLKQLSVAVSVFMTRDERQARILLDEKVHMRDIAQAALDEHLQSLREGRPETIETSALYVDMIRDLKRITAHLTSVAYPVLEEKGVLLKSRLIEVNEVGDPLKPRAKLN